MSTQPNQAKPPVNRGGRPAGAVVIANRLIAKELAGDGGVLPLEILIRAMRDYWHKWLSSEQTDKIALERATYLAEKSAPYFHAQLARVEHTGNVEVKSVVRVPEVAKDVTSWSKQHAPQVIEHEPRPRDEKPKPPSVLM